MIFKEKILFSPEECISIISIIDGKITTWEKNDRKYNSFSILYNEKTEWIFLRLKYFFESEMEMVIHKLPETIHFHKFNKGDWFGKHHDFKCERLYGVGVLLNSDFSGGNFKFYNQEEIISEKITGNSYIFDTRIEHEILPIINGERYSLLWFLHVKDLNFNSKNLI